MFKSDVLKFLLADDGAIVIRLSRMEPKKVKVYDNVTIDGKKEVTEIEKMFVEELKQKYM